MVHENQAINKTICKIIRSKTKLEISQSQLIGVTPEKLKTAIKANTIKITKTIK